MTRFNFVCFFLVKVYVLDIDFTNNHNKTQGMSASIEALNVRVTLSQQYNENSQYNLKCINMLDCDHHRMYSGKYIFN